MADSGGNPYLITPPPGLIPPDLLEGAREASPVETTSGTHRSPPPAAAPAAVTPPPFFAAPIGAPPAPPVPAGPPALVLADGTRHPLARPLLVGRNPALTPDWSDADLVVVADDSKSVSKTHAALALRGGQVHVFDLNSTNGVRVGAPSGEAVVVAVGSPAVVAAGDEVWFGDYRATIA